MSENPQDQHVYPAAETDFHTLSGRQCECGPDVRKPCPECTGVGDFECWRCGGDGLVNPEPGYTGACVVTHWPMTTALLELYES